jgi:hypothetical protein
MYKFIAVAPRTVSSIALVVAMLTVGFQPAAGAGTISLKGRHGEGDVMLACVMADGTPTEGTGPRGYGCKTPKGEVSCTAQGKCTGTCTACGK